MLESNEGTVQLGLAEIERLADAALRASGASPSNACGVARSIAAAEADGIASHGLLRLPTYCSHLRCGKVDGQASPAVSQAAPGAWLADACHGFAHPAIEAGFDRLEPSVRQQGVALLAVTRSYNCGVVGHHVERLAARGLVALAWVNTPAAIAPWGGSKALFGTNPLAFAVPRGASHPLVVDQSASVVARGEVMLRASQGAELPPGWALDAAGAPTTDPRAALSGSMLPAGGYKGAGVALMVEILAATLTGANHSFEASSFADDRGGPPGTGQLFVAIDPVVLAGARFAERLERLFEVMSEQDGVRLPGARRLAARARASREGVALGRALHETVVRLGAT